MRVYTYVVCICANVYSMYMYVSMHMSMYISPPVDIRVLPCRAKVPKMPKGHRGFS